MYQRRINLRSSRKRCSRRRWRLEKGRSSKNNIKPSWFSWQSLAHTLSIPLFSDIGCFSCWAYSLWLYAPRKLFCHSHQSQRISRYGRFLHPYFHILPLLCKRVEEEFCERFAVRLLVIIGAIPAASSVVVVSGTVDRQPAIASLQVDPGHIAVLIAFVRPYVNKLNQVLFYFN